MNRKALLIAAVIALTGLLSNCGSGGGSGSGSGGNSGQITITTAPPASIDMNQTVSLSATVTDVSQDAGVDWTCTPSPCGAFVPAHTASGGTTVWTTPTTPGTVTITATATGQATVVATARVTVNAVTVAITRAPPTHVDLSQTASIAATVTNDNEAAGVDWTCTPSPCGSFNPAHTASGVLTVWTAPATPGAVTITATSTSVNTVTATAVVTVNAITIAFTTPPPASIDTNQTASIAATVMNDAQNAGVDWTCTPAPCGSFAPAHTTSGGTTVWTPPTTGETVAIKAASTTAPAVSVTAMVDVGTITIAITSPPPASVYVNQSASIAATVTNDGQNEGVDWTCSPSPCGSFNPAHTASGATTVWTGPSTPGSVAIKAASTARPAITAIAMVMVSPVTIAFTAAPPASAYVNQTSVISATVSNDTLARGVDWTCTPAPCGSFNPSHTVSGVTTVWTAPANPATVTITAAATSEPSVTASAMSTVSSVTIAITTPPPASPGINQTSSIAATVTNDVQTRGVDWTCTPSPCGSFNPTHTASGAVTVWTAQSTPGAVTITAAATAEPSITATAMSTVTSVTITIGTPPPASVQINQNSTIAATVGNDFQNRGVDWTCTPSPCGTFNPAHTASGATTVWTAPANPATVTIKAAATSEASITATASATVGPVSIAITTPPPASVVINQGASIAATVTGDTLNEGVDWTCSPSPCGSFNPAHTASGATTVWTAPSTTGSVTLKAAATSESVITASATVTVTSVSIALTTSSPANREINQTTNLAATVTNDVQNRGVDWTCTPSPCGAFNPTHTASGATTVWTAPSSPGTATISAAATVEPSVTATQMVIVGGVAISITTPPPANLEINQTASVAATVTSDFLNAGVDWTCSPSPCGSFNPAHTASGAATVWTAPSTPGPVTLTAAATSEPSVTATSGTVTVGPVGITITTAPPSSLEINQTAAAAATVVGDSLNEGVDWTCSPSPCGSFNPAHTASGATTIWTAPSTAGSVTITATATVESSVTATSMVTVNPVATAATLSGQYAFYMGGYDSVGNFYAANGSVTLDGLGNVTAGEEDLNNTSYTTAVEGDALTGTYTVGSDGQGTMTLTAKAAGVADPLVGVSGVQTLSFTVVNLSHLLITEFDSAATSGGSMDLQSGSAITAGIAGKFAFTAGGFVGGVPTSLGAVYTATPGTPGTILAFGTADENVGGSATFGSISNGTYSAADSNGRGSFSMGSMTFIYYIVGSEAFYLVEVDTGGVLVGASYGQGSGTFSAASISSTNVMDEPFFGQSVNGPIALAGQFTSNGTTTFTGVTDYNDGGKVPPGPGPDTLTASYSASSDGYARMSATVSNDDFDTYGIYMVDPALNINDPNNSSGGGGALIAELDGDHLGIGFIVPQSATSISTVNEASGFAGQIAPTEYVNSTGQVVFGTTSFAGTTSVNDFNLSGVPSIFTQTPGESISGVITADTTNVGRYTVVVTIGTTTTNNRVSYVANGGLAVDVNVDASKTGGLVEIGSGIEEGQQ